MNWYGQVWTGVGCMGRCGALIEPLEAADAYLVIVQGAGIAKVPLGINREVRAGREPDRLGEKG